MSDDLFSSNSGDESEKIVRQTQEALDKLWKSAAPLEESSAMSAASSFLSQRAPLTLSSMSKGPTIAGR